MQSLSQMKELVRGSNEMSNRDQMGLKVGECDGEVGLGTMGGDKDVVEDVVNRGYARSPKLVNRDVVQELLFCSHADFCVSKAWREPIESIAITRPQISQAGPWATLPSACVFWTVSHTCTVGSALNVRYSGPGDRGPAGDLPRRVDMAAESRGFRASKYILTTL